MTTLEKTLTEYRLRTVRIGVIATVLILAALAPYILIPGTDEIRRGPAMVVMAVGLVGALVIAALPWRRLFARGAGMAYLYAWSILDILLITFLIALSGESHMEVFLLYTFTTLFFAASYPVRAQVALLSFTAGCYLAVMGLQGWPVEAPDLIARLGLLAVLTWMASFLSRELQQRIVESAEARDDAHRRFEDQRRSNVRLAELDRLKSDFLSNVSHELRTPLTAINGMGTTLEELWNDLDDNDRRELLARLNANAASLQHIITTLLDFSQLEAGRLPVEWQHVDVVGLIHGLVGRLDNMLQTHRVEVDLPERLVVRADAILLDRVLENLLANAVKHTPAGTTVQVRVQRQDDEALIEVVDHGPGIRAAELPHIAERFYRGGDPNTRRSRGTGLGLALVQEIIRLHHSELEMESEVGRGSRFAFRLDVVVREDAGLPTP